MDQHDLKQIDLTSELGTQSVVSEVLSGRRQINVRQAKALAQRFSVSAAVFI
jgi:HTH-type transcriptional regulator/antitoxin HigA